MGGAESCSAVTDNFHVGGKEGVWMHASKMEEKGSL